MSAPCVLASRRPAHPGNEGHPERGSKSYRESSNVRIDEQIDRFLRSPSLAEATRRSYRFDLEHFAAWLDRSGTKLDTLGIRELTAYAAELGRGSAKLAPASIARRLSAVRSFLRFTLGRTHVPDASLGPRRPHRLPDPPRRKEIEGTLDALEGDGPLRLRNRALVELVYSAGLRSREA